MKPSLCLSLLASALLLSSCANTLNKLEQVGQKPPLKRSDNPQTEPEYEPITWPTPAPTPPQKRYANSLWQPGARNFFRDQRASKVGDILTVTIDINDRAQLRNDTSRTRDSEEEIGAPNIYGLETLYGTLTPGEADPENLVNLEGTSSTEGEGEVQRQELIQTQIAAVVTQILPNGNFYIQGSQEMQINYDIREVGIAGIVRPEDIGSANTIDLSKVAQARVTYGGRGQIMDYQQPRWGQQVIDIIAPF